MSFILKLKTHWQFWYYTYYTFLSKQQLQYVLFYFHEPFLILSLCPTLNEWALMLHVRSLSIMYCSVKDQVVNTMITDCISGTGHSFTVILRWHNWLIHPHLDIRAHINTHLLGTRSLKWCMHGCTHAHCGLFTLPLSLPQYWNSKADGCHFNQN